MDRLEIIPREGHPPEIGRWLWALEEVRRRTRRTIDGLDQALLDWEGPAGDENAIGSLLYHIAGVEMGWLHFDVQGRTELPPDVARDFPHGATEPDGVRLKRVLGVPLAEHVARLERSRAVFLAAMETLTLDDWRRVRVDPLDAKYELTPEWAAFHLVEHEALHAGQIGALKARGRRAGVGGA